MTKKSYILTLSCEDKMGIVAAVSSFLAEHDGFILESAQFGDASTGQFFMRTKFEAGEKAANGDSIRKQFTPVAEEFNMLWELHNVDYRPKVLIMVSKATHCLNDILHRYETGLLPIEIPAIVSNHETLESMATRHNIPFHFIPVTPATKPQQEEKVWELIEELHIDVTVLARYMQILTPALSDKLKGRAINIHHSFLPGFKGANPYQQAYDRGVKIIGATAHYITAELDEGPIIEQEIIRVDHTHSPEQLKAMGRDIESRVLSHALRYHIEHRVLLNGNKTVIFG